MTGRSSKLTWLLILAVFWCLPVPGWAGVVRMEDDSGQTIVFERPFTRIISLYGAHTENLFALGLDKEIIGVTRHEVYPPEALAKPAFHYRDGPEKFIAARPGLILIRPMIFRGYNQLVTRLTQAGIAVVSLQPTSVKGIFDYWRKLGALTGRTEQAEKMVSEFKKGVAALKALTADIPLAKRKKVFFESIHSKMKTFAPHSTAVFALESAGGVNLAADAEAVRSSNIAAYGKERILSKAAQIDVYLAQKGPMNKINPKTIREEPAFKAIKAVRENRVCTIDEQIVSRPTLRLLKGIEAIGRILYPDRFRP